MKNHYEKARTLSREAVLQALFAWMVSNDDPVLRIQQSSKLAVYKGLDISFAENLIDCVVSHHKKIEDLLVPYYMERSMEQLTIMERVILVQTAAELIYLGTPKTAGINEAVQLCHRFGAEDGFKFVNGVLDRFMKNADMDKIRG